MPLDILDEAMMLDDDSGLRPIGEFIPGVLREIKRAYLVRQSKLRNGDLEEPR